MDDGFLLWSSNSNFDYFCLCYNKFHLSIGFTFEKAERIKNEKGLELQILDFLVVIVTLIKLQKLF